MSRQKSTGGTRVGNAEAVGVSLPERKVPALSFILSLSLCALLARWNGIIPAEAPGPDLDPAKLGVDGLRLEMSPGQVAQICGPAKVIRHLDDGTIEWECEWRKINFRHYGNALKTEWVSAPNLTYGGKIIARSGCSKREVEAFLSSLGKLGELNAGGGCMEPDPPDDDPNLYGAIIFNHNLKVWCSGGRVQSFSFNRP